MSMLARSSGQGTSAVLHSASPWCSSPTRKRNISTCYRLGTGCPRCRCARKPLLRCQQQSKAQGETCDRLNITKPMHQYWLIKTCSCPKGHQDRDVEPVQAASACATLVGLRVDRQSTSTFPSHRHYICAPAYYKSDSDDYRMVFCSFPYHNSCLHK